MCSRSRCVIHVQVTNLEFQLTLGKLLSQVTVGHNTNGCYILICLTILLLFCEGGGCRFGEGPCPLLRVQAVYFIIVLHCMLNSTVAALS